MGNGEEFNPFSDVVWSALSEYAAEYNAQAPRYPVEICVGADFCVAELSVEFEKDKDGDASRSAFAALMAFVSGLFLDGTVERIITQAGSEEVLVSAMLKELHTFRTRRQLKKLPPGGLKTWNGRRYGDLIELSSLSVAQAVYESGLHLENWPYALAPKALTGPWLEALRENSLTATDSVDQEQADAALREGLRLNAEPDPIFRTQAGMLLLHRHYDNCDEYPIGYYSVLVHSKVGWLRDDLHLMAMAGEFLLAERTAYLRQYFPDYPVLVEECGGGALMSIECHFDPAGGEECESACRESLRCYLFKVLSLGILDEVMDEVTDPAKLSRLLEA